MKRGFLNKAPEVNDVHRSSSKAPRFKSGALGDSLSVPYPKPERSTSTHLDAEDILYNGKYIRLTIPSVKKPGFAGDGQTQAILSPELKTQLKLSNPQFPRPIDRPPVVRHYIKEAPGMGLGMFASRDLSMGDLILAERPLLIIPAMVPLGDMSSCTTELQARTAVLNEWDETLKASLRRMSPEDQRSYMTFANSHTGQAGGDILGIAKTNGFGEDVIADSADAEGMYSIVCNNLSRINHSCSPNTDRSFDVDTFSLRLYACRDIRKDEQLFLTYYPTLLDPHQERQQELATYGFTCNCQSCEDGEASDHRRKQIQVTSLVFLKMGRPQQPEDKSPTGTQPLKRIFTLIELIEQEGIESVELYGYCMKAMSDTYTLLGDSTGAARYMEMYDKWNHVPPPPKA